MNILHLTSLLRAPLQHKEQENDILFQLALKLEKKYPGDNHYFIYLVPYSNLLFAVLRPKWKAYYQLIRCGNFVLNGKNIYVIGIPGFSRDLKLRKFFARLSLLLFRKRIRHIFAETKPDVLHAHSMRGDMELAEMLRKIYGVDFFVSARKLTPYSLQRIRSGKVLPRKILVMSAVAKQKAETIPKQNIQLIPHPVDEKFFIDAKISENSSEPLSLVSVCRLLKLKNIDIVIDVIGKNNLNVHYSIIGDGPEWVFLKDLINKYGLQKKIRLPGYFEHCKVIQELRKHALFIMPSYPETLGRVYFEAMASGIPVIAAKGTGVDGIIENGKQGYLVSHDDPEEIKNAIISFTQKSPDEKLKMKRAARELADHFRWDQTLEKYYRFYHE